MKNKTIDWDRLDHLPEWWPKQQPFPHCGGCKWWDGKLFGHCKQPEIVKMVEAWHPQKLPDWVKISIVAAIQTPSFFGCMLWEKSEEEI